MDNPRLDAREATTRVGRFALWRIETVAHALVPRYLHAFFFNEQAFVNYHLNI